MAPRAVVQGLLLAGACLQADAREASKVTPVEKVIELLKSLQEQTAAEGKKEAAAYDKYACFCKEQADEKLYMIEKSTKKIAKLEAKINQLVTDIDELNAAIKELANEIEKHTNDIDEAQHNRNNEHEDYKINDADLVGAIGSMEGAIKALKDSKENMDGNVKLDLAQVASKVLRVTTHSKHIAVPQSKLNMVVALTQLEGKQPAYEYRSNDIIQTLEDLKDTFLENKKEADEAESTLNSAWEKKDLNLKNLRTFAEKDKFQKEQFVEAKTETMETAEADKTAETKDKGADNNFMELLTEECEGKASQFDQRSTTRAGELTALAGAIASLEEKVAPSAKANKKLAQLQIAAGPVPVSGHWAWVQEAAPAKPVSFLQLRGSQSAESAQAALVQKATRFLSAAASKLGSHLLMAAAIRTDANADHFVKVRSIIKDLVMKLEDDAAAEADHKSFCDNAIGNEVSGRDAAAANVEMLTSEKSQLEAEDHKLSKEISELAADIASLKKGLKEATDLRKSEKEENESTISTAEEGLSGVELALKILEDFYATAFVQYVPPGADRSGKTIGDMAPGGQPEGDYHGNQEKSKGIIGLLEVILSDFDRTIQTVSDEEHMAQEEFDHFKETTEFDIADKSDAKLAREERRVEIKDELAGNADALKEENALLATAKKALEELESQCIKGEETYEERVAKRQKEIDALKEAHQILEDWKGF